MQNEEEAVVGPVGPSWPKCYVATYEEQAPQAIKQLNGMYKKSGNISLTRLP